MASELEWKSLFEALLGAEEEGAVLELLEELDLLGEDSWATLGDEDNNFSVVGNQHSQPTGALVEKVINGIDAVLMARCFSAGIDPEGPTTPRTMQEAAERLCGVPGGRLGSLTAEEVRGLARNVRLVATGDKQRPCYLLIDDGEGQTPESFPKTFLSIAKSNKIRIPFVQGKFNAGGTGVLQFCGRENLQLVASRRHPDAPAESTDLTRDQWGFTVVRRLVPDESDPRRTSRYVYLAPGGRVPAFSAEAILAVPTEGRANQPGTPYAEPLSHGTIIKLYNYQWSARSIATRDPRYELEKYLHSPCLPVRITEARAGFRANSYSTTISGIWASIDAQNAGARVEPGYPVMGLIALQGIGDLRYKLAVFTSTSISRS